MDSSIKHNLKRVSPSFYKDDQVSPKSNIILCRIEVLSSVWSLFSSTSTASFQITWWTFDFKHKQSKEIPIPHDSQSWPHPLPCYAQFQTELLPWGQCEVCCHPLALQAPSNETSVSLPHDQRRINTLPFAKIMETPPFTRVKELATSNVLHTLSHNN